MNYLDKLAEHYGIVKDTLSGGRAGDRYRAMEDRLARNINSGLPMLNKDPQDWGAEDVLAGVGAGNIKVVHGSPHKFTRFSDDAMSSGEGSQAFGSGHYSGRSVENLDDWYRQRLVDRGQGGPTYADWEAKSPKAKELKDTMRKYTRDPYEFADRSLEEADLHRLRGSRMRDAQRGYGEVIYHSEIDRKIMKDMEDFLGSQPENKGFMYELNLKPNQEDLLHWNKTLAEHDPRVMKKLDEAYPDLMSRMPDSSSGQDVYKELRHYAGAAGDEGVSKGLLSAGVPGHTFRGQGGKGADNYVMYNPDDIDVVRRIRGGRDNPSPAARKSLEDYTKSLEQSYRGGQKQSGGSINWTTTDKGLANEYAESSGGKVHLMEANPEAPVKFRHAEQEKSFGELAAEAMQQSPALILSDATDEMRDMYKKLRGKYGTDNRPLFKYWNEDPEVSEFFKMLGFDAIETLEKANGAKTTGLLQ